MDIKTNIKKIFSKACVLFTVIIAIYTMIVAFVNVDQSTILLDGVRVLLFFVFSLLISIANFIFSLKQVPSVARLLVHYAISALAFYICLMLPIAPTPSHTVVGLVIFTIIYFIAVGIIALFRARYKKQSDTDRSYKKHFS